MTRQTRQRRESDDHRAPTTMACCTSVALFSKIPQNDEYWNEVV